MNKAFLGIALAAHELWLRDDERGSRFVSPYGSNLSGSDLRGSDLRDSNLSGSNLRGSDLRGSNLRGSNLSGSNLSGSDLSGSDLRGSDLRGSDRIIGPQRSDGYLFTYCMASQVVLAGQRAHGFVLGECRHHVPDDLFGANPVVQMHQHEAERLTNALIARRECDPALQA